MMVILECQVLELSIGMNIFDRSTFLALLKQQRERPEISGLNGDSLRRMHKWLSINSSFIVALISLTSLVSMPKFRKNFLTKTRLVSLISIYIKD